MLKCFEYASSSCFHNTHRYEDGLVRLSTVEYKAPTEGNMDQLYMHLTNYSVNKNSEDFGDDDDAGYGTIPPAFFLCIYPPIEDL